MSEIDRKRRELEIVGLPVNMVELIPDIKRILEASQKGDAKQLHRPIEQLCEKYPDVADALRHLLYSKLRLEHLIPFKIVGIGRTGKGKTDLLKKIFEMSENSRKYLDKMTEVTEKHISNLLVNNIEKGTIKAYSITIITPYATIEFNDIVGFGSSHYTDNENLPECRQIINGSDLIYYVIDGSEKDYGIDAEYMKIVFKDLADIQTRKIVIVLNMIDRLILSEEDENQGLFVWDTESNTPTRACFKLIERRIQDISPVLKELNITEEQIVYCSVRKRYNLDQVTKKFIEFSSDNLLKRRALGLSFIHNISSLDYATSGLKEKVKKMNEDEIKEKIKDKGIDEGLRLMLERRLEELSTESQIKKILKKAVIGYFLEKVVGYFNDKRFDYKKRLKKSEGYQIYNDILDELYELLK